MKLEYHMKRYFIIFMLLMYVVFIPQTLAEEKISLNTVDEKVKSMCSDQRDGIYLLTEEFVYRYTEKDGTVLVTAAPENALTIFSDEGTLYSITSENALLVSKNGEWDSFMRLQKHENTPVEYLCVDSTDSLLFYSYCTADTNEMVLTCLDLKTKDMTVLPSFGNGWFACIDDQTLLSIDSDDAGAFFIRCHLKNGNLSRVPIIGGPEQIVAATYDSASNHCYIASTNGLYSVDENGKASFVSILIRPEKLIAFHKDKLAILSREKAWYFDLPKVSVSPLRIMGYSSEYDRLFSSSSGIPVEYVSVGDEGDIMSSIMLAMATQDESVDIYGFFAENGLDLIYKKGMYTELSQSASLAKAFDELYPQIAQALLTDQGQFGAWPVYIEPWARQEEVSVLESLGIDPPKTFEALLDAIDHIVDSDILTEGYTMFDMIAYDRASMLKYLVQEYIYALEVQKNRIDFNSEIFISLATRILEQVPVKDPFPRQDGAETPIFTLASVSNVISESSLPPLKLDTTLETATRARLLVLMINPSSRNKEAAFKYLEYHACKRTIEDYALYAALDQPLLDPYITAAVNEIDEQVSILQAQVVKEEDQQAQRENIERLKCEKAELQKHPYLVSPLAIENYRALSKTFVIPVNALVLYNSQIMQFCDQLAVGTISLDMFIRCCNEYVEMIYAENQ
ncbi:MAG: hypothetical protein RR816_02610 [Clostridia bacterium]